MSDLTEVELLWLEKRIENRIRFGRAVEEKILDPRRRLLSFAPGSIFAFVRWTSNDFGTVISRIDILRAVAPGQRCSTVPYVKPGGEILLRLSGWPKVERALQLIDAVEALDINPADAAHDYWHHVHNRLSVNKNPRPYTKSTPPGVASSAEGYAMTRRVKTLTAMLAGAGALIAPTVLETTTLYVWNASESVPIGLYRLQSADNLFVTELVAVQPPEPLATFLDLNGYLPAGVPMLKRVLALPGQTVCRSGLTVSVDAIEVGEARERDGRGRPLPKWQGCRVVGEGELFVMNWQSVSSLDGRYFGFLPASAVIGRALPVWTWED